MAAEMRYRVRADDGRYAGYSVGSRTASLRDASTAYVFRCFDDAANATTMFADAIGVGLSVEEYASIDGQFRVGDRVRFADPVNPEEGGERYEILEMRGDRLLARYLDSGMRIEPTTVLQVADLEIADG